MSSSLKALKALDDKYEDLQCLLLYFLEDTYEDEPVPDIETIKRFVAVPTFSKEYIRSTITQAKEVLALEPFPAEWVKVTANKYPFSQSHETKDADYYPWVKWMVEALEDEAKKAGKL